MRILIVGNGAREDALSWALSRSASTTALFAAPGNAGTAGRGENWPLSISDGRAIVDRCTKEKIDLIVVGPETAIAMGLCDKLRDAGFAVFGPNRSAGRLETSKIFAKRFMEKYGVPTARSRAIHTLDLGRRALSNWQGGVVVKADGLAAGKGVVVTDTAAQALQLLESWYGEDKIPGGGTSVLLEERLVGRELSLFALGDGQKLLPFASACDYKRAGDGDTGPNTGGMGAYSPPQGFPDDFTAQVADRILKPVLAGLLEERESYRGVLYCGIMWTPQGPKIIEFNVRFGDPETQVLMPRIEGDFAALLMSAARGRLDQSLATVSHQSCVGVVLATSDYPIRSVAVSGLTADLPLGAAQAFWGSSKRLDGPNGPTIDAAGGRVLTVAALGATVSQAREQAYVGVRTLAQTLGRRELSYRTDIALGPFSDS